MIENGIDNFYLLYKSIENNHTNHIYFYSYNNTELSRGEKTFHEVYTNITLVYSDLVRKGITKDDIVCLYLDNTYSFYVTHFALILIGAQTVLQSYAEPNAIVEKRLNQFKVTVLIVRDKENRMSGVNCTTYKVSELFCNNEELIDVNKVEIDEKDFLITFSSGTSGKSKGLGESERALFENVQIYYKHMGYNQSDRMLVYLPLASYQQCLLMWGSMAHKIDAVLIDEKTLFKGLVDFKPTIILAPPNFYFNLFRSNEGKNPVKKILRKKLQYKPNSNLRKRIAEKITYKKLYKMFGHRPRYLLTGMAPIDMKLLEYFRNAYLEIYQIYGQTEIGMICGNTITNNKLGTVGMPILQIHLGDDGEIITYN